MRFTVYYSHRFVSREEDEAFAEAQAKSKARQKKAAKALNKLHKTKPPKPMHMDVDSKRACGICSKLPCACPNYTIAQLDAIDSMIAPLVARGELNPMDSVRLTKTIDLMREKRRLRMSAILGHQLTIKRLTKDKGHVEVQSKSKRRLTNEVDPKD